MKGRMLFLLRTYLWTVVVFIIAKVAFMFFNQAGHPFTAADMVDVIRHGFSLDLSTALYFLIIPFLAAAVSVWIRIPRGVLRVYFAVVAIAFAVAFVADSSLYPFWGFKLDASCLSYLETPTEAMASVSMGYLLARAVVLIVLVVLLYVGYVHSEVQLLPSRHRLAESLVALLCIPLIVIGIRGGIGESTTNIGQVYFSQNQFLNHSAVNPVFSFLYSLSHTTEDLDQYHFMDDKECAALTDAVYTTESLLTDTLLTTRRPNIVIILLESAGEQFADAMPYLQQLKREGVYFANCYANSWRTDRGTIATLSGYPSFPSVSVMKIPEKSRTLPSIAKTLQQEGYKTAYLYGGDINFTNMRSYLLSTGWERLTWKADYAVDEQASAQWGVRDDITMCTLLDMMRHTPSPWLFGYSTLSSHEPWDVPTKQLSDEVPNAFAYLDSCLKDFIGQLRQSALWKDLLIVMVADHGINHLDIDQSTPLQKNHIPMLWVGGAVRAPRTVSALCNQSDLAATLLGQLQLKHDDFTFSRDVLSASYRYPTAVNNYNNAQLMIDSTGHILYDFDALRLTIDKSPEAERLLRLNKAILQTTTNDFKNRR